jgi:hypothetical protein
LPEGVKTTRGLVTADSSGTRRRCVEAVGGEGVKEPHVLPTAGIEWSAFPGT